MQEIVSQVLKRVCDGCDLAVSYELINPPDIQMAEMGRWYVIVREVWVEGAGFRKLSVQACSLECVEAAAKKLVVPPEPPISLADLQYTK